MLLNYYSDRNAVAASTQWSNCVAGFNKWFRQEDLVSTESEERVFSPMYSNEIKGRVERSRKESSF